MQCNVSKLGNYVSFFNEVGMMVEDTMQNRTSLQKRDSSSACALE